MLFECFVYQKHIDLHAISALEAIRGFMKVEQCRFLRRYVHWIVEANSELSSDAFFSMITDNSYYLLNPNKEGFKTLLSSKSEKSDQSISSVFVDVFPKIACDYYDLKDKLNNVCDSKIKSIDKRITWQCDIDISQDAQAFVSNFLLPGKNHSGILANPVYESFSFIAN